MPPTVLIADGLVMYAEALRSLLSPAYQTVGIASTGRELTELAIRHKPSLILTDVAVPPLDGLEALRTLAKIGLDSKFIILTAHREVSLAVAAFRAGASAFLLKTIRRDEFLQALKVVRGGGFYLSSEFPCDLATVLAESARAPAVEG